MFILRNIYIVLSENFILNYYIFFIIGDNLENNIYELRYEKGLTQQQLADIVGVTRQTINALENNRYNPSLLLAYNVTKALDKRLIEDVFILDE